VTRMPENRAKIELGRKLLALRERTPNNRKFGEWVRAKCEMAASDISAMMRVCRLYGDREEIVSRLSWAALVALSAPSLATVSKIIVIAHSLGSEVVLGALQQAALSQTALGITELIFAAPDVDRDLYLQRANQIKAAAGAVTLYASSTDLALLASLKKAQSKSRMGFVTNSGPTLVPGIEAIDVSAVGSEMFALNHSTYSTSRAVLDDIGRIISSSAHLKPPQRTPTLRSMPDDSNTTYWMYPY
jgi:esterase/lipase superfamily enzyme